MEGFVDHMVIGSKAGQLMMFDDESQDYPVSEYHFPTEEVMPVLETNIEGSVAVDLDDWLSESTSSMNVDSTAAVNTHSNYYSQETTSEESGLAHKKGRRTKEETIVLSLFSNVRYPYSRPKKEYVRVKLIRGFKRAVRQVADKVLPRTKIHGFDKKDKNGLAKWANFCAFVNANPALQEISPTSFGPDGRNQGEETLHKCFNDRFCREFFGNELVKVAFIQYLDLIFMNEDEKKLSKKFEFCATAEEKAARDEAWEKLRQYLYEGMFKDLESHPEAESLEEGLGQIKL